MEWNSVYKQGRSVRDILIGHLQDQDVCEVVDFAQVGVGEAYAAIRKKATGQVVAFAWQLRTQRDRFSPGGHFDVLSFLGEMEHDNPTPKSCPARILKHLTPLSPPADPRKAVEIYDQLYGPARPDLSKEERLSKWLELRTADPDGSARRWRETCEARLQQRRPADGETIVFAAPQHFQSGSTHFAFTARVQGRRTQLLPLDGSSTLLHSIPGWTKETYWVVDGPDSLKEAFLGVAKSSPEHALKLWEHFPDEERPELANEDLAGLLTSPNSRVRMEAMTLISRLRARSVSRAVEVAAAPAGQPLVAETVAPPSKDTSSPAAAQEDIAEWIDDSRPQLAWKL